MKYDKLVKELCDYSEELTDKKTEILLLRAAQAIINLQSTVVIVEVKENTDGVSNTQ